MSVVALRDAVPPDVYDSWAESDDDDDDDSASEVETEYGRGTLPRLGHHISASYRDAHFHLHFLISHQA
jgi:hypothetical protein